MTLLRPLLEDTWKSFQELFELLPLTLHTAAFYGELRTLYEQGTGASKRETKRHTADFVLAATALEHDAVLVSGDRIFGNLRSIVPVLRVQNWLTE